MKAIETKYNGILFRSRLEARWAILFDALKLDWVYEPECFEMDNGSKYTPDFFIPKYELYIEIKPNLEWMKNPYHLERYKAFSKLFIVLSGGFPNFKVCSIFDYYGDDCADVVFCPNSKYEPFFFTGQNVGEYDEAVNDDFYKDELDVVRSYRFWE